MGMLIFYTGLRQTRSFLWMFNVCERLTQATWPLSPTGALLPRPALESFEGGSSDAKTQSCLHADRAARRYRYHRNSCRHPVPRVRTGSRESSCDHLHLESEAAQSRIHAIRPGLRRDVSHGPIL